MPLLNFKRRRLLLGTAAGLASSGVAFSAVHANKAYPSRPLTFICPWPAGGTADVTMRALVENLSLQLQQAVHFRNVAGASGMMGTRTLATAAPDGYTIGQIPISVARLSQLGMLAFDPLKDLTYLARTSGQTFGIAVRSDSPWQTLQELLDAANERQGRMTYASAGVAGATHVGMEELLLIANVRMQHIAYKGGAPALADLLGGHVDVLADSSSWAEEVRKGNLRLLATWGRRRSLSFPDVPTLKEAGFDMVVEAPNGVGAPAGLPPAVEAVLRRAMQKAVMSPQFKQACERIDAPVLYQDADAYRSYVESQYERDRHLIRKLNLKQQIDNG